MTKFERCRYTNEWYSSKPKSHPLHTSDRRGRGQPKNSKTTVSEQETQLTQILREKNRAL